MSDRQTPTLKKIIVISYFFPPCAKAGAHRAYSLAEFLPRYGWEPIFIAPEKGYYGRISRLDNALLDVVQKYPIYRLPFFYPFNNRSCNLLARMGRRLWETVLIPDGRIVWNIHIKKKIGQIVKDHKPDVFFITATPFSSFLLAPFLKRTFQIPVILDYRDPWARNPAIERNRFTSWISLRLEKKAVSAASLVTTASYHMIDYIKRSLGMTAEAMEFYGFPYGFNGEYFEKYIWPIPRNRESQRITGIFAGFVRGSLNAEIILRGLRQALDMESQATKKLTVECYGTMFGETTRAESLIRKYHLDRIVSLSNYLPYREFLQKLWSSSFLILPLGDDKVDKIVFASKLFDYLGAKRPILYIGGQGQVSETIKNIHAGICSELKPEAIANSIIEMLRQIDKEIWYSEDSKYQKFDRRNIFADFCEHLNRLI